MSKVILPFLRSPYNYDTASASDESGLKCEDVSLAQQSAADDADINTIVRRFGLTGELPQGVRMPSYDDFSGVTSFHDAMNLVAAAGEAFDQFPADIRSRFNHDPQALMDFIEDPSNRDEAERLGIVVPKAPAASVAVSAAPNPPVSASSVPQAISSSIKE